ncbi:MAG: hypothetical protein LC135_01800 [Phycisphaerae bacterium]|nr:hypothetical protein [Phycisphaerae bacterium]MCZ2398587.1 hypothetical protein [Phycisphaerae bacterium]
MAIPLWSYNATGVNGLTALLPGNGRMSGASQSGNAMQPIVHGVVLARQMFWGPGGGFSALRTCGVLHRPIEWQWRIRATTQANLDAICKAIEDYRRDGRCYAISDGTRSAALTALLEAEPADERRQHGSEWHQAWRLLFHVMRSEAAANRF